MKTKMYGIILILVSGCFTFAGRVDAHPLNIDAAIKPGRLDTATFAISCFWCTQAQFQLLKGVKKVVAGYTGGHVANPSYKLVCTGNTGHAEACDIIYDPAQIKRPTRTPS